MPEVQIEDLWIPYFCITTDISASKMRVHTTGKRSFLFCLFNVVLFVNEKRRMLLPKRQKKTLGI